MTIETAEAGSVRASRREHREAHPIGEADDNIFDCPSCARPLSAGTRRCPGCSVRLIAGIRASLAATFAAIGLVAGLCIGGGVATVLSALALPAGATTVEPTAEPGTASQPSTAPAAPAAPQVVAPPIDPAALTALRQTAALDERHATHADLLTAALASGRPSPAEIARVLRSLAADAAFGERIAPNVAGWPAAADISVALGEAYADIGATAREGLAASLNNTAAYVASGKRMLIVLADLQRVDAAARALVASLDPASASIAPPSVPD